MDLGTFMPMAALSKILFGFSSCSMIAYMPPGQAACVFEVLLNILPGTVLLLVP